MADACKHAPDQSWETDLIWHYLHKTTTEAKPWRHYHNDMDPLGQLSNRHQVYELLINEGNLKTEKQVAESKIPWNQNNAGFLKTVGTKTLYCGSLIKIVFIRYMDWNWGGAEPISFDIGKKGFNAASLVIESLRDKKPVRVSLGGHYVGIVGHRCRRPPDTKEGACSPQNEFLCLEPWAGGSATGQNFITYAGNETCFLGIIQQENASWKYDKHTPQAVEFDASWIADRKKKRHS
jgi:hypothetical protein